MIIFNFMIFFSFLDTIHFFFFIIDLKRMRIYLFGGTRRRNHDFKVIFIVQRMLSENVVFLEKGSLKERNTCLHILQ